ncbi:Sugar (pentulose or hexulose) kinase [Microlunatus sagamiharensis]|uniref:Sugar (Pentulose or hexulose) kinase n=1 Tax=Microlunatus sagamiharensis TaxID=546874 RepID=A0A1H2LQS2_9ACTN|nr:FGGY-family carbohydrate kinase [Microlunatus sagamiharensis]SDU83105.1 Sugar (pentulose or hexulose) kinase [Microlunatus sagamiharensis]
MTIDLDRCALGVELGSTRIKAVLVDGENAPVAVGGHDWENSFTDRLWTYPLGSAWEGLQAAVGELAADLRDRHDVALDRIGALGVSAMMHGYLAFDADGELLVPFRTWRNTNTGRASEELSTLFGQNVPHRWSVAHLYQALLDHEEHVGRVAYVTTLAGYVHWRLTGEKVIGVGDASGMFPIDPATHGYDERMLAQFDELAGPLGLGAPLVELLPRVLSAGDHAGSLTSDGAALLDPSGALGAGVPLCPPEGDAGTGMVATNSVAARTGNVSAGTSIFAMVVLDRGLSRPHRELDLVTTPAGDPVAMVHCNNGASELAAWVSLFREFAGAAGSPVPSATAYEALFGAALEGEADGGGLVAYNYLAGEPITETEEGRPLFVRTPGSSLRLGTFMRTQLYSAFATLRVGMDVLQHDEDVAIDAMFAHGGVFKTAGVAQRFLAAAVRVPVAVGDVAGEGGAWGIAVLAAYLRDKQDGQSLAAYLDDVVFADASLSTVEPDPGDVAGFDAFMERWTGALDVQRAAVEHLR